MKYRNKWVEIEKRLNLQSIGEFIQHGGDVTELDTRTFSERADAAYQTLEQYIEDTCGKNESERILENIIVYSSIKEDIYFALGMKAGAKIITQLTNDFESDC